MYQVSKKVDCDGRISHLFHDGTSKTVSNEYCRTTLWHSWLDWGERMRWAGRVYPRAIVADSDEFEQFRGVKTDAGRVHVGSNVGVVSVSQDSDGALEAAEELGV